VKTLRIRWATDAEQAPNITHYMVVDGRGLLIDLSGLQHSVVNPDSFVDPTITGVTWGLVGLPDGKGGIRSVEGGTIMRQGQQPQTFFDRELLKPYLAAFDGRRLELARAQAEYDLAHAD
jgi:hypothetical protein